MQQDIRVHEGARFSVLEHARAIDVDCTSRLYQAMAESYFVMRTNGDGNCLFRALSWTLFGTQEYYLCCRLLCICEFLQHLEFFRLHVPLLTTQIMNIKNLIHCTAIIQPTNQIGWGDSVHIKAMSIATDRIINLYTEVQFVRD